MRDKFVNNSMNLIKKYKSYDNIQLERLTYGLTSLYLTTTKLVVITLVAILLGIFKEYVIFILLYNVLRCVSFGLHAKKSWMCWVSSSIIFIGIPYLCLILILPIYAKLIIALICIIWIYKYSPADTHKRPIVDKKRRDVYKFISTSLAIIFTIGIVFIRSGYLTNALLFAMITQSFMISPYMYRLFKMPYDNYKSYQLNIV